MRSHKGMIIVAMLIFSLGALGVSAIFANSFSDSLGSQTLELTEEFELAYVPHDAIWIQSNQEMIDQAFAELWPGNGSKETPYTITGYSFNQDTQPLRIWNTDLYWVFTGNLVDSDGEGMQCGTWIEDVSNGVITDNIFRNRHSGLVTIDVDNVNITNNEIYSNTAYGIEFLTGISNSLVEGNRIYDCNVGGIRADAGSQNVTVSNNYISNVNGNGISLRSGTINGMINNNRVEFVGAEGINVALGLYTVVAHNTVVNSTQNGLALHGFNHGLALNNTIVNSSAEGISTSACNQANFSNNTIQNCADVGFDVISGKNTTMMWNTVQNTGDYAIDLTDDTEFFEIKFNTFDANCGTSQICDDGTSNDISYNYYSDWTSPDADSNDIVDNPYVLDGLASNEDPYPLTEAGVVPSPEEPTPTPTATPLPMDLILIGVGAIAIVIIISGVVMLRKR